MKSSLGISPFDRASWPDKITAKVVEPGENPRLHGYDIQGDLAKHYRWSEAFFLSLTGELPKDEFAPALDIALIFLSSISVNEAPAHAAVLAGFCGTPTNTATSIVAITLAEQARTIIARYLKEKGQRAVSPRPPEQLTPMQQRLAEIGLPVAMAGDYDNMAFAALSVLENCGLSKPGQLEAAWVMARLPVALAEASIVLALNELEKHGADRLLGEDLEQVAILVAVDEDVQALEVFEVLVDVADAVEHVVVVVFRHVEEIHAVGAHPAHGLQDVVGGHGDVLHAGAFVEVDVLLDLALFQAFGRLVDGEFDVAVAVGHHFRHQGGVFGGDVLVVEGNEQFEAHHVLVELDPLVHGAEFDVADAVVHIFQADGFGRVGVGTRLVAGQEHAAVVAALHQGVDGIAVGFDGGQHDFAVFIAQGFGREGRFGAALQGGVVGAFGVVDGGAFGSPATFDRSCIVSPTFSATACGSWPPTPMARGRACTCRRARPATAPGPARSSRSWNS